MFDLRDNGGGLLDDAIQCIDLIAPEGTLAFAEDKNGTQTLLGTSTSESQIGLPVVCLVNGSTASAAELFASSLRTLNGARLVGTTTQGKGTIQSSPSACPMAVLWWSPWQSWSAATAAALTAPV